MYDWTERRVGRNGDHHACARPVSDVKDGSHMVSKERLHRLVDELPDGAVPQAERLLGSLAHRRERALPFDLANAPVDDEEETPEERAAVAEAYEALAHGDLRLLEDVKRDLGLRFSRPSWPDRPGATCGSWIGRSRPG